MRTASPTASDMTAIADPSAARSRRRCRDGVKVEGAFRDEDVLDARGGGDRVGEEAVGRAERLHQEGAARQRAAR